VANAPVERRATRSSFAFDGGSPVQTRPTLDPGRREGRVVGGESTGSVVRANPFTLPADDGIPQFLLDMAEPYIREKQAEAVVKGATDYAAGRTIKDIAAGDSGIARIFGTSGYHEGAAAFAAADAWAKAKTAIASDPEVEKLPPDKLGSYLAGKYREAQTGDPLTDQMIQHSVMQDHGPLVASLTAKHEAYAQTQARAGYTNNIDNNGTYLQQVQSDLTLDPASPAGKEARATAMRNFVSSVLARPFGMRDDVYRDTIVNSARAAMAKGNFYAFEAMKANGLDTLMTDEQAARMETAYQTATSRTFADVSAHPEISRRVATLDMQIRTGLKDGKTAITLPEIDTAVAEINNIAAGLTGVAGREFISGEELTGLHKQFNEGVFSAGLRLQARQFQLEDREAQHQWEEEKHAREQAEGMRIASTMASAGNTAAALATGAAKEQDVNLVFGKAVASGDMQLLATNFSSGRYVNSFAANQMQSLVENSIGIGVTEGFKQAYGQWSALDKINPAAAMAYMGDHANNMASYDRLVKGGEKDIAAYAASFGKGELGRVNLPTGVATKDARASVDQAITANDRRWFGLAGTLTPLATSSKQLLTELLMRKAGDYAQQRGVSMDVAAADTLQAAIASGEIERAGPFVWNNQRGTEKFGHSLGLPDDTMDKLVASVADQRLKAAGFPAGISGDDYTVLRASDANGAPFLYIRADDGEGSHVDVALSVRELKEANRKVVLSKLQASQPHPAPLRIGISSAATAKRQKSYKDAMQQVGGSTDIGTPVANALVNTLDIVGTSQRTGDLILSAGSSVAREAVRGMRKQFNKTTKRP
jgi:hypothetical protein